MDAKKLAAWGVASTLVTSHIPSNITYTMVETSKETNRQLIRKENASLEIPNNIDIHPFILGTESRLTKAETKLESVEQRVDDLSDSLKYLSNDIKNLASELRIYLKEEIGTVRESVNAVAGKVDNLENKMDKLETTINNAKWFLSGAAAVIGILVSIVSYIGFDKVAKAIMSLVANH